MAKYTTISNTDLYLSYFDPSYVFPGHNDSVERGLTVAPKRLPGFCFFSIAMGADCLFYVKTIETHACSFLPPNISAVDSEIHVCRPRLHATYHLLHF